MSAVPSSLAIGVLAAGSSKRLGQPKQLVNLQGQSLIAQQIQTAASVCPAEILVTVGAHAPAIEAEVVRINKQAIQILRVADFDRGMSASIQALACRCQQKNHSHLLLMLVDQWRIDANYLHALLQLCAAHPRHAIASCIEGLRMPPAIFPSNWFNRLQALQGDQGAKMLLRESADVIELRSNDNLGDIDLPLDLLKP